LPTAASLAEKIKKQLGVTPKMIEGRGGIFDVKADDKLIFSKHQVGRFPEDREVLDPLKKLAGK
jgi:selenoprotein W-related protein